MSNAAEMMTAAGAVTHGARAAAVITSTARAGVGHARKSAVTAMAAQSSPSESVR